MSSISHESPIRPGRVSSPNSLYFFFNSVYQICPCPTAPPRMFPVRVFATINSGCTEQVSTSTDKLASVKLILKKKKRKKNPEKKKKKEHENSVKHKTYIEEGIEKFYKFKTCRCRLVQSYNTKALEQPVEQKAGFCLLLWSVYQCWNWTLISTLFAVVLLFLQIFPLGPWQPFPALSSSSPPSP